jgi:NAD(P)-dependent dehydrogenase (short-subunit alcohol dehydrogenase family)
MSVLSDIQLDGVRALVTGGTSGLGFAMARALAQAGATVAVTSRDGDRAREAAGRLPGVVHPIALEVSDPESVRAGVAVALEAMAGIDLLVNNAGLGMRTVNPRFMTEPQPFWEVPPAGFRAVLESKALGSFLVARETVPRMMEAGGGRVVTISMNESTMRRRGFVPYGPSGAAVEALGRVMAADLTNTPVRANLLLPGGATLTGMIPDGLDAAAASGLLDPGIMGPPIVWLASAAAGQVHDERIVATEFGSWLAARERDDCSGGGERRLGDGRA